MKQQQTTVEWLVEKLEQNKFVTKSQIHIAELKEKEQQDKFAIGFAEWCIKKRIDFFDDTEIGRTYIINGFVSKYKMTELLEIYKKENQK